MAVPVPQRILLAQQKIAEEHFQTLRVHVDVRAHVRVVRADKRVTEVPYCITKRKRQNQPNA